VPSSTSSSKPAPVDLLPVLTPGGARHLFAVLALAALLFAAWSLLLWLGRPRTGAAQNQLVANQIAAERVLRDAPPVLLLGSSMTALVPEQPFGRAGNLGFNAASATTGLELVRRAGLRPAAVVVETNLLDLPADEGLVALADPWSRRRQAVPALRVEHQPVNLALSLLRGDGPRRRTTADPGRRERGVQAKLEEFAQAETRPARDRRDAAERAAAAIATAGDAVDALLVAGIRVVLVELPIDARLAAAPRFAGVRAAVRARFPAERYRWVELPQRDWQTRDGIHLVTDDAEAVAMALAAALR